MQKSDIAKCLWVCVCRCVCLHLVCVFAKMYVAYVCLFVYACVFRERSSLRDTHQWPNTFGACLPSLNELSRSCEKGSSFLASILNKMNCYVRFAIHSIFPLSSPIKALNFTFRWQWAMHWWRTSSFLKVQNSTGRNIFHNIFGKGVSVRNTPGIEIEIEYILACATLEFEEVPIKMLIFFVLLILL